MLLSRSRKFVFVHVPKTGGDAITEALQPLAEIGGLTDYANKHATAAEIRARWFGDGTWGEYLRFAFVRNPWDAMHSDWQFCRSFGRRILAGESIESTPEWLAKCRTAASQSFVEFARENCQNRQSQIDQFCCGGKEQLILNLILRYEDLADAWPALSQEIAGESLSLPQVNATRGRTNYREDYDQRTIDLVRRTFERDIAYFGYRFGK